MDANRRGHGRYFTFRYSDADQLMFWIVVFVIHDFPQEQQRLFCGGGGGQNECSRSIKKDSLFNIVALVHGLEVAFGELLSFQIIKLISICACAAGDLG